MSNKARFVTLGQVETESLAFCFQNYMDIQSTRALEGVQSIAVYVKAGPDILVGSWTPWRG